MLLLVCADAAADTPNGGLDLVALSIPDCESASGAEIEKLVALELAAQAGLALDAAQTPTIRASLRCTLGRALITVEDARRPNPLVLELQVAQTRSEARPRLLALAIAELIATSRLEHAPVRKAARQPPPPPPSAASERSWLVWLGGGVLRAFAPASWLPTLAAGAAHSFGPLAINSELGFDWARRTTADAVIDAHTLSLALAPSYRLTGAPFDWSVGFGLRAGYAWLSATPRTAGLAGRPYAGLFIAPLAQSVLQLDFNAQWSVRLALEVGYVVKPVRGLDADRAALLELGGLRASALVGIGLRL